MTQRTDTWRETPSYDAEARRDRAEAYRRTWQYGRHIDTLPLEPTQAPLAYPPAFPKLEIYGAEPWTVKRRP
jgi:hypothetical protein